MESDDDQISQRLVKALAHPLRVRILMVLAEGEASPKRIAEALDEKLGNVSYHVRVLQGYQCIELVDTRSVRGAVEHFYRAKAEGFLGSSAWRDVPDGLRDQVTSEALRMFVAKAVRALEEEAFEKREASRFTCVPLMVDEKGWREVVAILTDTDARLDKVIRGCAKRLKPGQGIPVLVAIAAFESGETHQDGET